MSVKEVQVELVSKSRFSGHVVDINIPGKSPDKSD